MQIERKKSENIQQYLLFGSILTMLTILYAPLLLHWYEGWLKITKISLEHEYFSHGIIGLPFAAYISWLDRHEWQKLPSSTHPLGGFLLGLAGIFYISGLPDLVNLSFPIMLAGISLWFKGIKGLKQQIFPLLLIFLATPTELPYLIAPYTLPLQSFIAGCAGFFLIQLGMDVTIQNINIFVGDKIVEVAPHCAGLKMLFTSLYVSLMLINWYGTWTSRATTVTFLSLTVAMSIIANIIRNTLLTLFHGTGREQLFNWLHEGWGGDLYSAIMLVLLIGILNGLEKLKEVFSIESEIENM